MDIDFAREALRIEAQAIERLAGRIDDSFLKAAAMVMACRGRVVVTGMGKAGIIGHKLAATLSSTGTPAMSMHPAEALHGDLGMVQDGDLALVLSNSGETEEITRLLPFLRKVGVKVIAITSREDSFLARHADVTVATGVIDEACPLGLAPTASTTVMLALGDALALTVSKARGFTAKDYRDFHPAGDLGRRSGLVLAGAAVGDIARTGDRLAAVPLSATLADAARAMSKARGGAAAVLDGDRLAGIVTDGDFRRAVLADPAALSKPLAPLMTRTPTVIRSDALVGEAQRIMSERRINSLPVVDAQGRLAGMLDVQDIVNALL
jgi:arabinose-5-phosphate isomerase